MTGEEADDEETGKREQLHRLMYTEISTHELEPQDLLSSFLFPSLPLLPLHYTKIG